jgi:hypothetical protein
MSKKQNTNKSEKVLRISHHSSSSFEINTILHTKDGRKIGNAIIIGKDGEYNIIKTDYGNECKFTDKEIRECFYIAHSNFTDEQKKRMIEVFGKHKYSV